MPEVELKPLATLSGEGGSGGPVTPDDIAGATEQGKAVLTGDAVAGRIAIGAAAASALATVEGRVGAAELALAEIPVPPDFDTLGNKPAVIAAGATKAEARGTIDAADVAVVATLSSTVTQLSADVEAIPALPAVLAGGSTKTEARAAIDAADVAAVVALTGNQTVEGTKTFSAPPVVPAPTADGHPVNRGYVNGLGLAEISSANATNLAGTASGLASGRRLHDFYIAEKVANKEPWPVRYNGTAWPALTTVPAAFRGGGGAIIWDSQTYPDAPAPAEARDDIDFWDKNEEA